MNDQRAVQFCCGLLERKAYHSKELEEKLRQKEVPDPSPVIAKLMDMGALNDDAWLDGVVRRERRAGHGPHWIFAKLKSKDIHFPIELYGDEGEVIATWLSKPSKIKMLDSDTGKQKLRQALLRRGFSKDIVLNHIKFEKNIYQC